MHFRHKSTGISIIKTVLQLNEPVIVEEWQNWVGYATVGTSISGVFQRFCKSARSASRQRENFMESLHSDGSATDLLIIWVEKIIPLIMKSKQKPYPSIVFLSIFVQVWSYSILSALPIMTFVK